MVGSTIRNIDLGQCSANACAGGNGSDAGLRIVVDIHGEVVRVDMPAAPEGGFDGGAPGWDAD